MEGLGDEVITASINKYTAEILLSLSAEVSTSIQTNKCITGERRFVAVFHCISSDMSFFRIFVQCTLSVYTGLPSVTAEGMKKIYREPCLAERSAACLRLAFSSSYMGMDN